MNIHVGNLSPQTSLAVLRGCFEVYGAVTDVTISTYEVDGKSKASGFVKMPSPDHAHAAIVGLKDKELGGNILSVLEE
jgi:RNA recognition motif-containing protein